MLSEQALSHPAVIFQERIESSQPFENLSSSINTIVYEGGRGLTIKAKTEKMPKKDVNKLRL